MLWIWVIDMLGFTDKWKTKLNIHLLVYQAMNNIEMLNDRYIAKDTFDR